MPNQQSSGSSYYDLLKISPAASVQQVRQAYREMSKLYHPDTTALPAAIATLKFQQINEAYATLSSPERRIAYDLKIGYSRLSVMQPPSNLNRPVSASQPYVSRSAYLDPNDRPLSAGEIFALFILGVTFIACLILVVTIGLTRGEVAFQTTAPAAPPPPEQVETVIPQPALADTPPLSKPEAAVAPLPTRSGSEQASVPAITPQQKNEPKTVEPDRINTLSSEISGPQAAQAPQPKAPVTSKAAPTEPEILPIADSHGEDLQANGVETKSSAPVLTPEPSHPAPPSHS